MPQVLKDEVRARIEVAALQVFAERGFPAATMSAIAARAGVGTASTYRYHAGKRELFEALVTPALAARFEAILDARVRALSRTVRVGAPRGADDLGEELLRFWLDHRLAVVVLLDRAAGTPYAGYGERFVERLVEATLAELRPRRAARATTRFVLARIFEGTRRTLAAILEAHADERALREAIEAFWSYQIPGLRGLAAWARRAPETSAPGPDRGPGATSPRPERRPPPVPATGRSRTGAAR